jgi:hypothetical protein
MPPWGGGSFLVMSDRAVVPFCAILLPVPFCFLCHFAFSAILLPVSMKPYCFLLQRKEFPSVWLTQLNFFSPFPFCMLTSRSGLLHGYSHRQRLLAQFRLLRKQRSAASGNHTKGMVIIRATPVGGCTMKEICCRDK